MFRHSSRTTTGATSIVSDGYRLGAEPTTVLASPTNFNESIDRCALGEVLSSALSTRIYDTFRTITDALRQFETSEAPLLECLRYTDVSKETRPSGASCYGLAEHLIDDLRQAGINSYAVPFDCPKLISEKAEKLLVHGHVAVVVPFRKEDDLRFFLLDPGFFIPRPIEFTLDDESQTLEADIRRYSVSQDGGHYPWKLDLFNVNHIGNHLVVRFDPFINWLNPSESCERQFFRGLGVYKLVASDADGAVTAAISVDLRDSSIRTRIGDQIAVESFDSTCLSSRSKEVSELLRIPEERIRGDIALIVRNASRIRESIWLR